MSGFTFRSVRWAVGGIALAGVAFGLSGCATPGPGAYGAASADHQMRAERYGYMAQRDQNLARWQAANGDSWSAAQSQAAAQNSANAAQWEQTQANKDSWLGSLGF